MSRGKLNRWPILAILQKIASDLQDAFWSGENGEEWGFSVRISDGKTPTNGYMVAVSKEREKHYPALGAIHHESTRILPAYIALNLDLLTRSKYYLGGWYNPGDRQFYVDVSERFIDKDAAIQAGRERGQIAIFDVKHGQSIYL